MRDGRVLTDYEAVKPLRRPEPFAGDAAAPADRDAPRAEDVTTARPALKRRGAKKAAQPKPPRVERWAAQSGHLATYAGLFLFTAFVFFRPYELFDAPFLREGAQYIAILTILIYLPSQFAAEGNLTARPREVHLALLLLALALLSVPTAINPGEAWDNFVEFGKVILIFVVAVNVANTERRLRWLIMMVLVASVMLSISAFNDYQSGHLELRGVRVKGMLGGLFDNPNDLALHLVTMAPLAVGLAFARRGVFKKIVYVLCAVLFVAGVVVTFSRGGFLGLAVSSCVMAWKLGRRNRFLVMTAAAVVLCVFIAAAPGGYGQRVASMFGGDATGSADARRDILWRSTLVALRNPLTGVGLGNFHYKGQHDQVSHNAYTQVGAEMGLAALAVYVFFMVTPVRRLRQIERESLGEKERVVFYYLAVGMQASIIGYMVSSFFASVAHLWYVYYLVAYAVCLRRLYAAQFGASGEGKKEEGAPLAVEPAAGLAAL